MDAKTTISISEARKRIFDIAHEVQKPGKQYTLTENGKPKVVLMSAEEYESFMETMEVLHIFPDLDKKIAQVERDIKTGAYKKYPKWEDIKRRMTTRGAMGADKITAHEVSSHRKADRRKSNRKRS